MELISLSGYKVISLKIFLKESSFVFLAWEITSLKLLIKLPKPIKNTCFSMEWKRYILYILDLITREILKWIFINGKESSYLGLIKIILSKN